MGEQQRHTGTVKWFNATKGYGFITPADGGEELFVHQTSIEAEGFRSLKDAEPVEYEIEAGEDGRTKAVKVTGPEGTAPQGAPRRSAAFRGGAAGSFPPARGGRGPPRGRGVFPPPYAFYPPYGYPPYGYYPPRGRGRGFRGRGRLNGGRGRGPAEGGAAQESESSGLQVVVHNLPWATTWQQLKELFKEYKVERADIVYDAWGKSRGFGTVRFSTKEDADAACEKHNNTELEGRVITVRLDRFA